MNKKNQKNGPLGKYELDLIKGLRKEAYAVKDCFTRYSIQGIGLFVVALAIIVRAQFDSIMMFLVSLAIITLLSALARMGTHKYATASRLSGYELHLQRVSRLSKTTDYEWRPEWTKVGWEEAMKAWRIVQATVFQSVYISQKGNESVKKKYPPEKQMERMLPEFLYKRWKQDDHSPKYKNYKNAEQARYFWFEPDSMIARHNAAYYPGGYLRTMIRVINSAMFISFLFLALSTYVALTQETFLKWLVLFSFLFATILLFVQYRELRKRQSIIENGLLSIHSCAILWQAIIIAHFRAIRNIDSGDDGVNNYKGYTEKLAFEANSLSKYIFNIHEWMKPNMGNIGHHKEG